MSRTKTSKRKLGFESLEDRRVFAGQVTATVVNRELVVTGGAAANFVTVQQQVVGAGVLHYVVRGLAFEGNFTASGDPITPAVGPTQANQTKVNNTADVVRFPASGIDKVKISLKGGNDAVRIGGDTGGVTTFVTNRLQVETGLDNDYLLVKNVRIDGAPDEFSYLHTTQIVPSTARGQLEAGNDKLVVQSLRFNNTDLFMGTGGGNDSIFLSNLVTLGTESEFFLYAGAGNDRLNWSSSNLSLGKQSALFMGAGTDNAIISGVANQNLLVDLGAGNSDVLRVSSIRNVLKTTVRGGEGSGDGLTKADSSSNNLGPNPAFSGLEFNDFI